DWAFALPFLSTFMRRVGGGPASPHNAARLLDQDELVMAFPEGIKGTGKPFSERYRLQRFGRGGFVEVALPAGAPRVPRAGGGPVRGRSRRRRGGAPPDPSPVKATGAGVRGAVRPHYADLPRARPLRAASAAAEGAARVLRAGRPVGLRAGRGRGSAPAVRH